jgi:hypothetical protein
MVPVAVRVENVADGHLEPRRDLGLEVAREVAVDRIAHDDALGRYQEHGVVVIVLRAIELPGDVDDAPHRRLWLLCDSRNGNQRGEKTEKEWLHDGLHDGPYGPRYGGE